MIMGGATIEEDGDTYVLRSFFCCDDEQRSILVFCWNRDFVLLAAATIFAATGDEPEFLLIMFFCRHTVMHAYDGERGTAAAVMMGCCTHGDCVLEPAVRELQSSLEGSRDPTEVML